MDENLFEPMLKDASLYVRSLPTRRVDFNQVDLPELSATVDLIVAEAEKHQGRCREFVDAEMAKDLKSKPLGAIIAGMYSSDLLIKTAEKEWSSVLSASDGGETNNDGNDDATGMAPPKVKRSDGKSESCSVM